MKLRTTKTRSVFILYFFTLLSATFLSATVFAQVAITNFTSASTLVVAGGTSVQVIAAHSQSVNDIIPNRNYTVTYANTGNMVLHDFSISGTSYHRYTSFDTIMFRRSASNGIPANGNKQQIYCAGPVVAATATTIPLTIAYPQVTNYAYMERVMKDGYINRGCDNIFTNTGDLTFNNIERVDVVKKSGFATSVPSTAGFIITERGGNDGFKIAAIKTIDASGNPTSFGSVLSVPASAFNPGINMWTGPTVVMRKDHTENVLRPFSQVASQSVKGLYVRFSDLNVTAGQRIYGYALMAPDVTATTSAQLLNYSSSTYFPTNTDASVGGLDLASSPGMFTAGSILPVSLVSFDAGLNNGVVNINWEMNNEAEISDFEIERSYDAVNFSSIGIVQPRTSQSPSTTYQYTDQTPGMSQENIYYRLQVKDNSGAASYSVVKHISNTLAGQGKITVYPNPASEKISIELPKGWQGAELSIKLCNMSGTTVLSVSKTRATAIEQVNISALSTGTYMCTIISGKESFSQKILKY